MKTNQDRRKLPVSVLLVGLFLFSAGVLVMKYASKPQPGPVVVNPTTDLVVSRQVTVETAPRSTAQLTTSETPSLPEQVAESDSVSETAAFDSQPPAPAQPIYSDPAPVAQPQSGLATIQAIDDVTIQSQSGTTTVASSHTSDSASYVYLGTSTAVGWHQPSKLPSRPISHTYIYPDQSSSEQSRFRGRRVSEEFAGPTLNELYAHDGRPLRIQRNAPVTAYRSQPAPRSSGKLETVLTFVAPAAIGAGIGASAGGGKGAGIGALVGVAGGAIYHLAKGRNRDRADADEDDDRPHYPGVVPRGRATLSSDGRVVRTIGGISTPPNRR